MKYWKQVFIIFLSFTLFTVLNEINSTYKILLIENNNLYSNSSTEKGRLDTILKKIPNNETVNIFKNIEPNIRAFYSTNYDDLQIPVYQGTTFNKSDSFEALVGSEIFTKIIKNKEYFEYQGQDYEVIGKLGKREDSNLYQQVLINDSSFLNEENSVLIKDIVPNNSIFAFNFEGNSEYQHVGFEHRDNSVVFFKSLNMYCYMLLVLSIMLLVILFYYSYMDENKIKFLLGYSQGKILINNLIRIFVIIFFTSIPILSLVILLSSFNIYSRLILFGIIFFFTTIILYSILYLFYKEKTYGTLS